MLVLLWVLILLMAIVRALFLPCKHQRVRGDGGGQRPVGRGVFETVDPPIVMTGGGLLVPEVLSLLLPLSLPATKSSTPNPHRLVLCRLSESATTLSNRPSLNTKITKWALPVNVITLPPYTLLNCQICILGKARMSSMVVTRNVDDPSSLSKNISHFFLVFLSKHSFVWRLLASLLSPIRRSFDMNCCTKTGACCIL
jgi:hypothetical protein